MLSAKMPKTCAFCGKAEMDICGPLIGPFLHAKNTIFVHGYCAYFSWFVWLDICESRDIMNKYFVCPDFSNTLEEDLKTVIRKLQNVPHTLKITPRNMCHVCKKGHASTGCAIANCPHAFHLPCAEGRVRLFYCSLAYVGVTSKVRSLFPSPDMTCSRDIAVMKCIHTSDIQEGKYGLVRPFRFAICLDHDEWHSEEYEELVQYLEGSYRKRLVNLDEIPLTFRVLVSNMTAIKIYQPNLRMAKSFPPSCHAACLKCDIFLWCAVCGSGDAAMCTLQRGSGGEVCSDYSGGGRGVFSLVQSRGAV